MLVAPLLENEADRLESLKSYDILDSMSETDYDEITELASQLCGTKVSLISLIDDKRQWFKSAFGTQMKETPRDFAFCTHTMQNANEILIVPDSRLDVRFADNPLVTNEPHVIFYAGMPLVNKDGYAMGSLCVLDSEPKLLNAAQMHALKILANQVIKLFEARKSINMYKRVQFLLQEQIKDLQKLLADKAG